MLESLTAAILNGLPESMDVPIKTRKASVEGEVDEERLRELRQRHGQNMLAAIRRHVFPPALIGSRRASLVHKVHCMLHQLRLECGSWRAVNDYLQTVISFTTDHGTEAGLADFVGVEIAKMFPYWQQTYTPEDESTLDDFGLAGSGTKVGQGLD